MATITTFPTGKVCNNVQSSNKILPFAGGASIRVDFCIYKKCPQCGTLIAHEAKACPKCHFMETDSTFHYCTAQSAMTYMDVLRTALRTANVPQTSGYDMALAA